MSMKLRRITLWILGAVLLLLSFLMILIFGKSYTFKYDVPEGADASSYRVGIEQDDQTVSLTSKTIRNGKLCLTFRSKSRGKAFFSVEGPDGFMQADMIYVHRLNIMTVNSYMGYTRGSRAIPFSVILFLIVLLLFNISEFRKGMAESLYQYKNVRNLGWILLTSSLILNQFLYLRPNEALVHQLENAMNSASVTAIFVFPIAFILAIMVSISNIRLMRKEGFAWRNMLGVIMSVVILIGTMLPQIISDYISSHPEIIDIHNQREIWPYIDMFVTNIVLALVTYLEFILISTVILAVKAARQEPSYDIDYLLILGCQIRQDGTLTKLLQGRADRALEFARKQDRYTQKALTFVPSGGQGSDEVIPEAQAIRNYLLGQGVPEEKILVEDGSTTTQENMQKSYQLIRKDTAPSSRKPKIAFATTNYHVFRSGIIAYREGLDAVGMGAKTRSYFWINAFIREFIATLYSERKTHHHIIRVLSLLVILSSVLVYYANIL